MRAAAGEGGMGRPPPTCPEGLGHQPGQIAGDFGPGEVVVVEGEIVDGTMNVKGNSGEASERREKSTEIFLAP